MLFNTPQFVVFFILFFVVYTFFARSQRARLFFPTNRQPIVVSFAVRGLPVADQEDGTHAARMYPT